MGPTHMPTPLGFPWGSLSTSCTGNGLMFSAGHRKAYSSLAGSAHAGLLRHQGFRTPHPCALDCPQTPLKRRMWPGLKTGLEWDTQA